MKRKIGLEIICFLFIVLFTYTAVTKLMDVQKFRMVIGQSPLLTQIALPISWIIPISELMIVALLFIPRLRMVGLIASLTLMIIFTAYISIIMNFSEHIPCSCGGVLSELRWNDHLLFNIAFVVLASIGVWLETAEPADADSIQDISLQKNQGSRKPVRE